MTTVVRGRRPDVAPALCRRPLSRFDAQAAFEISRRRFLAASAAMVALAACGGDDTSSSSASSTRSVQGSRGPVDVPANPKRVAALIGSADVDVITLGLEPVFSGTFAEGWVDLPGSTV